MENSIVPISNRTELVIITFSGPKTALGTTTSGIQSADEQYFAHVHVPVHNDEDSEALGELMSFREPAQMTHLPTCH